MNQQKDYKHSSEEMKARIDFLNKKRKHFEGIKLKIFMAKEGKKLLEEIIREIRGSQKIQKVYPVKNKLSVKNIIALPYSSNPVPILQNTDKKASGPHKGSRHTEESKRKMSLSKMGYLNSMKGKKHSEETKQKIRLASSKQIHLRKDTSIEIKIQEYLKKEGIKFENHKNLIGRNQPDIFIEPDITIYCDGCFFHGCEQCFPDRNRLPDWVLSKQITDKLITLRLRNEGYIVLRFWEHDINKNFEKVMFDIKSILLEKHEPHGTASQCRGDRPTPSQSMPDNREKLQTNYNELRSPSFKIL